MYGGCVLSDHGLLSPVIPVGFRFTHNSAFFPPSHPQFCLVHFFLSFDFYLGLLYVYIFRTTRTFFACRSLLYSSPSICILKINWYVMVFYQTRSHSFLRFWACRSTVLLPNKKSGREVQSLAAFYPTVRQVGKNIHSRMRTPGHT